ncbi:MAG TPA: DUF6484 domain-containing protein [Burkholderiales bacterium]|nr:DUF6484 domain-containing protein [Burkholderiales bacterium]
MKHATVERLKTKSSQTTQDFSSPRVGHIVGALPSGQVTVDFPGNPRGPVAARTTVQVASEQVQGSAVLLLFEEGNPGKPVIVGFVQDAIREPASVELPPEKMQRPSTAVIDGKRVVLEASEEIVLQCGRGSITLTSDGRIVIKGAEIVSRAARAHKIKGATVNIN